MSATLQRTLARLQNQVSFRIDDALEFVAAGEKHRGSVRCQHHCTPPPCSRTLACPTALDEHSAHRSTKLCWRKLHLPEDLSPRTQDHPCLHLPAGNRCLGQAASPSRCEFHQQDRLSPAPTSDGDARDAGYNAALVSLHCWRGLVCCAEGPTALTGTPKVVQAWAALRRHRRRVHTLSVHWHSRSALSVVILKRFSSMSFSDWQLCDCARTEQTAVSALRLMVTQLCAWRRQPAYAYCNAEAALLQCLKSC